MAKLQKGRQDKLRRALAQRGAKIPPAVARLGNALWDEVDDVNAHQECIAALPAFVGAEAEGLRVSQSYPHIKWHLDRCDSCSELYADMLQVTLAEVGDALPQPDSIPAPDLSFLEDRSVVLKGLVLKWTRQILTTLAPRQVPDLQVIADVFFEQIQAMGGKFSLQAWRPQPLTVRGESGGALAALALTYVAAENLLSTVTPQQIDDAARTGALAQLVESSALSAAEASNLDAQLASRLAREFAAQVAHDPASLRRLMEHGRV